MSRLLLETLNSDLIEFEKTVKFVEDSLRLRPRLNEIIDWALIKDGEVKNRVLSFMGFKDNNGSLGYGSLYASIHATLEQFIREFIEYIVSSLNEKNQEFKDIDEKLIKNNMKFTGNILANIHKPLDHHEFDYHEICRALGTCYPKAKETKLNPVAFSFSVGTLTVLNIERVFNGIGIPIAWDDFGKDTEIRELFESKKTRGATKELKIYMGKMLRLRNRIAHTGAAVVEVGYEDVLFQIKFVRGFCNVLSNKVVI